MLRPPIIQGHRNAPSQPFFQCLFQLTHHQFKKKMQPLIPHQFETALILITAPYSPQKLQPGTK